ncbi:MAG: 16S rRNA (cytosine(1402)-N(4))-methyltransferase RsmH [Bacteroidota bacterium]
MDAAYHHQPVLAGEVSTFLAPRPGGIYVDATLGGGGHAARIAEAIAPGGTLIGIDRDLAAIEAARARLHPPGVRVILVHDNFANLRGILGELGVVHLDGLLLDLGVSSAQLDLAERGFSYRQDALLDMRMDQRQFLTARHLVNEASERELARIIFEYGEERWARRIARFIAERRRNAPIETTGELAELIKAAIPAGARRGGPHPAKRTFQALRIAVNGELDALREALAAGVDHLAPDGRLVAISFHSLEDRLVKEVFAAEARSCRCPPGMPVCRCPGARLTVLTRRPVVADPAEVARIPRALSAKLRAAARLV